MERGIHYTDQYPHLAEMATEHIAHPDHYYDQAFEFGLELISDCSRF